MRQVALGRAPAVQPKQKILCLRNAYEDWNSRDSLGTERTRPVAGFARTGLEKQSRAALSVVAVTVVRPYGIMGPQRKVLVDDLRAMALDFQMHYLDVTDLPFQSIYSSLVSIQSRLSLTQDQSISESSSEKSDTRYNLEDGIGNWKSLIVVSLEGSCGFNEQQACLSWTHLSPQS